MFGGGGILVGIIGVGFVVGVVVGHCCLGCWWVVEGEELIVFGDLR